MLIQFPFRFKAELVFYELFSNYSLKVIYYALVCKIPTLWEYVLDESAESKKISKNILIEEYLPMMLNISSNILIN